jgi:hypothetical protein
LILTTRPRLNAVLYAMLLEELVSGPCSVRGLCEVTGLERKTVRKILKSMQDRSLIHLSAYDKDSRGRSIIPMWSFGQGKDVKNKTMSQAEACRNYRARKALRDGAGNPFAGLGA